MIGYGVMKFFNVDMAEGVNEFDMIPGNCFVGQ